MGEEPVRFIFFNVHGTVHPYNIVQVNNQRDAASFYLVYYHSICFGHGSCPSSGVINKTVKAATSLCQCVWGEVVLSLVVCVR